MSTAEDNWVWDCIWVPCVTVFLIFGFIHMGAFDFIFLSNSTPDDDISWASPPLTSSTPQPKLTPSEMPELHKKLLEFGFPGLEEEKE